MIEKNIPDGGATVDPRILKLIQDEKKKKEKAERDKLNKEFRDLVNKG